MALWRKNVSDKSSTETSDDTADPISNEPQSSPEQPERAEGPWDSTERQTSDDDTYLDLGALRVRGRPGHQVRLQSEHGEDHIGAALIVAEEEALELRAFAGPRSGSQWADVREDILAEVDRLEGTAREVEGPFGTEVHVEIPVSLDDGQSGFQPSRVIGIEGPRWMLRATLLGRAALEPRDDGDLMDILRDTVVVRGDGPMMAREPLLLTVPDQAVIAGPDNDGPESEEAENGSTSETQTS